MKLGVYLPAGGPAESSDLQQSESGGRADSDAGNDFGFASAFEGGGSRRYGVGAEGVATAGRGIGLHQRRAETRSARSARPTNTPLLSAYTRKNSPCDS